MPEQGPGSAEAPNHNSQLWIPLFEDFYDVASSGSMTFQEFTVEATKKLFDMVREGYAPDLGVVQDRFYTTQYDVQLTAVRPLGMAHVLGLPNPDRLVIRNPLGDDPKRYGLAISTLDRNATSLDYLGRLRENHQRNVKNLREDTGIFDSK